MVSLFAIAQPRQPMPKLCRIAALSGFSRRRSAMLESTVIAMSTMFDAGLLDVCEPGILGLSSFSGTFSTRGVGLI